MFKTAIKTLLKIFKEKVVVEYMEFLVIINMSTFLKNHSMKIIFDFTEYHCKFSFVSTL